VRADGGIRLKIDLAYHGGAFHGWQVQPGLRTVQGELAACLGRLLGRAVVPVGAGRTDAGVHARGQVCHADVRDREEAGLVVRSLPRMVPEDVAVTGVRPVSLDFDARLSPASRRYLYRLLLARDVFQRDTAHLVERPLERGAMDAAAALLAGAHDFTSFCKRSSLKDDSNVCAVDLCRFHWSDDSAILEIRANRFLHHMVRTIVGTLLEVGWGQRSADAIPEILAAGDRARAGHKAPAQGLCLEEVVYPEPLLDPEYRRPPSAGEDGDPEGDPQ
jgi:tRNA pseudouridine38-40 synthase